jgi:WD40 repeat protein
MPLLNGELFDAGGKLLLTYFGRTWSVHDMEGSLLYAHQSSESYTWPVFSHDCKHILHGSGSGLYKTDIDKYATNCIFRSDTTIQNPINTLAENFVRLRTADGKSVLVREDGIQVRDLPWLSKKGYFSPAKYFFIEKMEDTTVALYTVLGKQVIFPEQIKGIDFSMDDQFLIVHLKSGKSEVRTREGRILKLTRQRVDGVFSPSGRYVLLYNELEATIELLGLKKATILNISPKGKLLSCAFSPDEEYVACAFENQVVEIVKTTGEPVLTIAEIGSVRFSPAGNYLLVLKNNDVKIYNRDGLQIEKIESGDTVTNFEFSMDDRWLVVSDYNGTVKVIPSPLGIHHYFTANAPSPAASDKYNRN